MTLSEALDALDGKAELTADDALTLRQVIFAPDQTVDTREAEALFTLNADAGGVSQAWHDLFIEAITDFVVRQQTPAGYVDDAKAEWLIAQVRSRSRVRADVVEMLIHVLETADKTPDALDAFALGMVKAQLIAKAGRGKPIVPADVERVRRALYATGGESNIAVSRKEAEVLFDLNDALKGADVDPAWGDLFMRAVGNAVLYEATWAPDAAAELKRQVWEQDTSIHPLKRMGVFKDLRATFGAMRGALSGKADEQVLEDAYQADQAREASAEVVTGEEAHWLVGLIGRSGGVDANEQALVRFIHENARSGDEALDRLLQQLGPAPVRPEGDSAEPRSTFGLKAAG